MALPTSSRRPARTRLALSVGDRLGHRDITPASIFLTPAPGGVRVKILDFGVAKELSRDSKVTQTGMIVGMPRFRSPEQLLTKPGVAFDLNVAGRTADKLHMRSILRRGTEQLHYEFYKGSGETPYVLRIVAPDGQLVLDEQFPEPYALHERTARVERLLVRGGWHGPLLDS